MEKNINCQSLFKNALCFRGNIARSTLQSQNRKFAVVFGRKLSKLQRTQIPPFQGEERNGFGRPGSLCFSYVVLVPESHTFLLCGFASVVPFAESVLFFPFPT